MEQSRNHLQNYRSIIFPLIYLHDKHIFQLLVLNLVTQPQQLIPNSKQNSFLFLTLNNQFFSNEVDWDGKPYLTNS